MRNMDSLKTYLSKKWDTQVRNLYFIPTVIVQANFKKLIEKFKIHGANAGYYLIPGGGLESGETPEECCAREVREETGYIVKPVFHFLTVNEYYEEYKFISHYFLCDIIGESEQNLTANEIKRGLIPE